METDKAFTRMLDFQQVFVDNTFGLMKTVRNQSQALMNLSMDNNPWLHGNGKKVYEFWADACEKSVGNYKSFMDANLNRAREMFEPATPGATPAQPEKES